jgi:hypothetical protein
MFGAEGVYYWKFGVFRISAEVHQLHRRWDTLLLSQVLLREEAHSAIECGFALGEESSCLSTAASRVIPAAG